MYLTYIQMEGDATLGRIIAPAALVTIKHLGESIAAAVEWPRQGKK